MNRQGGVIEITPQMIEAGAIRLSELDGASSVYLAEEVFSAMLRASQFSVLSECGGPPVKKSHRPQET